MYYQIGTALQPCEAGDCMRETGGFAAVLTPEETAQSPLLAGTDPAFLQKCERIRYCKAEVYPDAILGTIAVPAEKGNGYRELAYCLRKNQVIFWDSAGICEKLLERIAKTRKWKHPSAGLLFCDVIDLLTEQDFLRLEEEENRIARLETEVLGGACPNFNHQMLHLRKTTMRFYRYYTQLTDALHRLLENENDCLDDTACLHLRICMDRLSRLQGETQMLREYSMQVREVYQAQLDIRQNKIMKILTVVATIFLPLTLVTGWYGMNFANMPELKWRYGYALVIAASVLIVAGSVWICKKKKFL